MCTSNRLGPTVEQVKRLLLMGSMIATGTRIDVRPVDGITPDWIIPLEVDVVKIWGRPLGTTTWC